MIRSLGFGSKEKNSHLLKIDFSGPKSIDFKLAFPLKSLTHDTKGKLEFLTSTANGLSISGSFHSLFFEFFSPFLHSTGSLSLILPFFSPEVVLREDKE